MNRSYIHKLAAASLVVLPLFIAGCSSSVPQEKKPEEQEQQPALSIIELLPEADEVLVNEDTDITVKLDPSDYPLTTDDFTVSGGICTYENGHLKFRADEPGSYTITAKAEGVESNPVTIQVVEQKPDAAAAGDSSASGNSNTTVAANPPQSSTSQNSGTSKNTGSSDQNSQQSSQSSSEAQQPSGHSADTTPVLSVDQVMANPSAYAGQTITVSGLLPQNAADANRNPAMYLVNEDGSQKLPLTGRDQFDFGGCKALVTGVLSENTRGVWYLNVSYGVQMSDGAAGDNNNREPGTPVSTMPSKGVFQFAASGVRIRNGMDGLEGADSGYVFNAGMTVHYDAIYQKDGYTWIAYTARSGARHSVAIGNDTTVLYGFLKTAS